MNTSSNTTSSAAFFRLSSFRVIPRNLLKSLAAIVPLMAVMVLANPAAAAPNGTRPSILTNLAVTPVSTSQMRVAGKLTTLSGTAIAGMPVTIYAVGEAYFTRWATVYTSNNGSFTATMSKPPAGTKLQIEVEGNGVYARPLPTFNRP